MHRIVLLVLACSLLTLANIGVSHAQPSGAQVMRDTKSKGVISVKLRGPGRRSWSSLHSQYFWEQNVLVVRKYPMAGAPNATLEIGGIMRYTIAYPRYVYNKFLVTWNEYKGIPKPSAAQLLKVISANKYADFFTGGWGSLVKLHEIKMGNPPNWEWHTPNSVSVNFAVKLDERSAYSVIETVSTTYRTRFYRDSIQKPWSRYYGSRDMNTNRVLAKRTLSKEEGLQPQTIAEIADRKANPLPTPRPTIAPTPTPIPVSFTPFKAPNVPMRVSFPSSPVRTNEQTAPTSTTVQMNDKYPMHTYEAKHFSGVYQAIAVLYPTRLNRAQAQNTVQSAAAELAKANNWQIKDQSEFMAGTFGSVFSLESENATVKMRVWATGPALFQMVVSAPKGGLNEALATQFFNSFKLEQ